MPESLTEQVVAGLMARQDVRTAFPRLEYFWRQSKLIRPCRCRQPQNRSMALTILRQAKEYILTLPPDQKARLKALMHTDQVVGFALIGGRVQRVEF